MKTIKYLFTVLSVVLVISSCKDNSSSPAQPISTDEAAQMVSSSLSSDNSGATSTTTDISAQASKAVVGSNGRVAACGYSVDTTYTKASAAGKRITFSYTVDLTYGLTCSAASVPQTFSAGFTSQGSFEGPNLSSTDIGSAQLSVTDLAFAKTSYVFNGTYKRTGTFQSKIGNKNAGTSEVDITLVNLTIDKSTYKVLSGSGTITIIATVASKGTVTYTATLTFNGDGTATATINSKVYVIDLTTGDVTAK